MFRPFLMAAWLIMCGAASAQTAPGMARVEVRLTDDGVRADVRLSRAVTSFQFAAADVVREGDFTLLTEELTLNGDTISGATPFRRFSVLIRPLAQERDAKYPAFFRVGGGGVLYAPALIANGETWRTTLSFRRSNGQIIVPTGGPGEHGSVYIGPRSDVTTTSEAIIIARPDTPPELRAATSTEMLRAIRFYTEQTGVPLDTRPVLVIAYGGDGSGYVGDVTPGPFVSLRMYGATWSAPDANMRARLSRFISHEAFHFWNGSLVSNREGVPTWLHEGGAEYAALMSARDAGEMDEAAVLDALGQAMSRCKSGLQAMRDVGMNDLEFLSMHVRYPCGTVIQWAADLAIRKHSNGEHNVLDAWGALTRTALSRPDHAYVLDDFTSYEGAVGANGVITLLTETSGAARWDTLASELTVLGATVESRPSDVTRRQALLFHLLGQHCTSGNYGFSIDQRGLTLEDNATCGALANGPALTSVEGGDVIALSVETYARAQAACAAGRNITFVADAGHSISVPCRTALPDAPSAYFVTAG